MIVKKRHFLKIVILSFLLVIAGNTGFVLFL
jgi:hypothetical protein